MTDIDPVTAIRHSSSCPREIPSFLKAVLPEELRLATATERVLAQTDHGI